MSEVVVDVSVVFKWFAPEDDSPAARALQDKMVDGGWTLLAPDLLLAEIANILWKKRDEIPEDEALDTLRDVISSGIEFVTMGRLVSSAYEIGCRFGRTAYDSLYIALALEHNCDFVTADERLFNAISAQEPRVKLLRDYVAQ